MSQFTGELRVSFSSARYALLWDPLVWELDHIGSGRFATIPAGFTSDGATVPRPLWWLMPPWGDLASRAPVLHDFLLDQLDRGTPIPGCETRKGCDWQFYLALRALDVNVIKARVLWTGVRAYSIGIDTGIVPRTPVK